MTQRRPMCDLILISKRSLYFLLVVALVTPVCSIQSPSEFGGNRPNLNAPSTLPADEYGHVPSTNYDGPNESVEERLAAWRQYQQQKFQSQTPIDEANPRDEDGRMKLIASASRGSISFFFFVLMWRTVHHYELADQSFKGTVRLLAVIPTVLLFLGNMMGCVASVTSPASHASKKRMKAILNLNKLVEISLLVYNVLRLTVFTNKLIIREIYVGRTLSNFLFMIQCQLFTKVAWGVAQVKKDVSMVQDNYYDGYQTSEQQQQQQQYYQN